MSPNAFLTQPAALLLPLLCLLLAAPAAWAQGRPASLRGEQPKPSAQSAAQGASAASAPVDEALRLRLVERLASRSEPINPSKAAGARPAVRSGGSGPTSVQWAYGGAGAPEHWGELKPEYRLCGIGTRQSPIDIRDGIAVDLEPIGFDYRPGPFNVIDNGSTVQVDMAAGSALTVMGRRYELQHISFHRPGEARINGRQFEMSAQLLHKDAEGRLALLAVPLELGREQPLVQQVWNNLPLEKLQAQAGLGALDPGQLLPDDRGYYTFMGSLTAPPCTEGVLWMVLRQPVPVSGQQIEIFAKLYPMNARPVQPGSGRLIKQSR